MSSARDTSNQREARRSPEPSPPPQGRSAADQVLDLLLEALERRNEERRFGLAATQPILPAEGLEDELAAPNDVTLKVPDAVSELQEPTSLVGPVAEQPNGAPPDQEEVDQPSPHVVPTIQLGRTLTRLLLVVALLVVVVNIPINRYGTSLARIMPDSASLVIRDGLVLKGSGPDIYVLEDNQLRWISSLEAFEYFEYRWDQVHVVEDSFLEQFELGEPIHVLLKCPGSLHIYALENGKKRWIKDIPAFEAAGYQWEDVKTVDCAYLRSQPQGPTIPEDAGAPPQP